ncbi:helix-turn-helix domain-containing protein [Rugamonas sp. FT107W]|uniref:Helix-turn-helix domain-containing protein n=1 Tax=Duganella vulcania TaxID=2692166 RepID=A0A845HL48_9BURK|nr:helix-turn-helix domain-containing protein [Duganella vulcania]MYN18199.1 helix-turn-helix domain-containing protein [Duganella vulcania]
MSTRTSPSRKFRIAVIAFDGINPFHLSVPCQVFGAQRADCDSATFDVKVCAEDPGTPLSTTAGFDITATHGLAALSRADIVILPSWHSDCRPAPATLLQALRRAHQRGAQVVGLCVGSFPLAEAGLLDGRTATTHWALADTMSERYPKIKVDREVLYVDEGEVVTSAGVAAGLDCCLHLLRQLCGAEIANRVARQLVVAPHRQGGQAQFIERPLPVTGSDDRFAQVLAWVGEDLTQDHSIDVLAERALMSRRNFTRHFRQATGTSVKQWLLNQRLAHARHLLESSEVSVEMVAQQAGFGSALSLRQHFRATLRTSPSEYRKLYRSAAPD